MQTVSGKNMRDILVYIVLTLLLVNCHQNSTLSLSDKEHAQIIGIQPFGEFNAHDIPVVINEISIFFRKKVIILNPKPIPERWLDNYVKLYCADSLISELSGLQSGNIVEVIGLTHKPLFTIKDIPPFKPYYDEYIFGLAHEPGNACIISDYKISTIDTTLYNLRLRNAIIHEVGHNMGLSHCQNAECLMSTKNRGNDYCKLCRKKLTK